MNDNIYFAFGELALDVYGYEEEYDGGLQADGGVSAYNALYYLASMGNECIALGGVGYDKENINLTGAKMSKQPIIHKLGHVYSQANIAMASLEEAGVNCTHIGYLDKAINMFFINKKETGIEIGRVDPNTGDTSIKWGGVPNNFPAEMVDKKVALIVSNFEPSTSVFISKTKSRFTGDKSYGRGKVYPICSMDITNKNIFSKYPIEWVMTFLSRVDLVQCNENTFEELLLKHNQESDTTLTKEEFIRETGAKVFTITKGKNGAEFYYLDDSRQLNHATVQPKPGHVVHDEVDSTGAGDAFHAVLLESYMNNLEKGRPIDGNYFRKVFEKANALSREVIKHRGARIPVGLVKYALKGFDGPSFE